LAVISKKDRINLCGNEKVKGNSLWIGNATVEGMMPNGEKANPLSVVHRDGDDCAHVVLGRRKSTKVVA